MNVSNYTLWTAVVTPLTHTLNVDYRTLSSLVHDQEDAGNGLLILGSTAEALNLPLEEKKKIVEHVLSLNPKTPMMVGVGGHQLEETLEWIHFLETKNLQPFYKNEILKLFISFYESSSNCSSLSIYLPSIMFYYNA